MNWRYGSVRWEWMEMSEIADVHKVMKDERSWTGGPLMMN